jgi:DUF4097 and DUF4098 domain-containing protein YvlB
LVSDSGGATYVKTSFGAVEATRVDGDLTVESSNGGVRASGVKGNATVRTSFAPVSLESVAGAVDVDNQNGAIEVRGLVRRPGGCSKIQLKASFAPIRVALDPQGSYTLAARTSFGRVSSEIPIATTGERGDSLSGTIGGGHCEVILQNSNGNVEILKGTASP